MSVGKTLTSISAASILFAALVVSPAAAWHPKGTIIKQVQNQTTGSTLSDANSATNAVDAKPGDVLKYVITVSNIGEQVNNTHNDMVGTVLKDTLPAGVELATQPDKRQIVENLGRIKPGQKVTKEYLVKVTKDGKSEIVENKACFTGDSEVKDKPQAGCDVAVIKINLPAKPGEVLPATTPAELPKTGPADLLTGAAGVSALGYATHAYLRSKRNSR